jgi:hypothetical protein
MRTPMLTLALMTQIGSRLRRAVAVPPLAPRRTGTRFRRSAASPNWLGLLLVVPLLGVFGCREVGSPVEPVMPVVGTFDVHPSVAPPGTIARLAGLDLVGRDLDRLSLWFGSEEVPALLEGGDLLTVFPLYLGTGSWPQPPQSPVDVELREGDVVLARSKEPVTVSALPPAPGATERVRTALQQVTLAYGRLFDSVPIQDEYADPTWQAIAETLHWLLTEGDFSIAALQAEAGPELAVLDALLASSGILDQTEAIAAAFSIAEGRGVEGAALTADWLPLLCRGTGEDFDLACKMQIYYTLPQLTEKWKTVVGVLSGAVALTDLAAPWVIGIKVVLHLSTYILDKVGPSLLPSKVELLEIKIEEDEIARGRLTDSRIEITAVNEPVTIKAQDVFELLVDGMGINILGMAAKKASEILVKVVNEALRELAASQAKKYAEKELNPIELYKLPSLKWGPVTVTSADLVVLKSDKEDVIRGEEEPVEWRGLKWGTGKVGVETRGAEERSKVLRDLRLCLWCRYEGGAFGPESKAAEGVEVKVVEEFDFLHSGEMTGYEVIAGERRDGHGAQSGQGTFTVRAGGHITGAGNSMHTTSGYAFYEEWRCDFDAHGNIIQSPYVEWFGQYTWEFRYEFNLAGSAQDRLLDVKPDSTRMTYCNLTWHYDDVDCLNDPLLGPLFQDAAQATAEYFYSAEVDLDGTGSQSHFQEGGEEYYATNCWGEEQRIGYSAGTMSWTNSVQPRDVQDAARRSLAVAASEPAPIFRLEAVPTWESIFERENVVLRVPGMAMIRVPREALDHLRAILTAPAPK